MSEATTDPQTLDDVIDDVIRRRAAGECVMDEQVISQNPHLGGSLKDALRRLAMLESARRQAADDAAAGEKSASMPRIPNYEVRREVSRGGQAVVFEAIQTSTGRRVAIKMLHGGKFSAPAELARFEREVRVLATLDHPNIVSILDRGQTPDGHVFLVMDFISGRRLDEFLFHDNISPAVAPVPSPESGDVLKLFMRVCDAVDTAHRCGVVHRDLKPSNVLVDDRGEPHVVDFGLARAGIDRSLSGGETGRVSVTGQFIGSLPWASPEQVDGKSDKIDARTDVYSLGVILYQMLTGGQFPYEVVGTMRDVLNNILTAEPTPPSRLIAARDAKAVHQKRTIRRKHNPPVNEVIEAIVLKALAKNPNRRYQTAGELAKDVENYLSGLPTSASMSMSKAFRRDRPRRRLLLLGMTTAVVTAAVCGIAYMARFYYLIHQFRSEAK